MLTKVINLQRMAKRNNVERKSRWLSKYNSPLQLKALSII